MSRCFYEKLLEYPVDTKMKYGCQNQFAHKKQGLQQPLQPLGLAQK